MTAEITKYFDEPGIVVVLDDAYESYDSNSYFVRDPHCFSSVRLAKPTQEGDRYFVAHKKVPTYRIWKKLTDH